MGTVDHDASLRALATAVEEHAAARAALARAVVDAREAGHSWEAIGAELGLSAHEARERYGGTEAREA